MNGPEVRERLNLMRELGRTAGRLMMNQYGRISEYELKGKVDLVTEVDQQVENATLGRIQALFPRDSILAEEGGSIAGDSGFNWIIDPLDGTTNFAHGYPFFAFSCGLHRDNIPLGALVEVPFTGETFFAEKGQGACRNEKRIHVSDVQTLNRSLLVTGLPYFRHTIVDELLAPMRRAILNGQGLRRGGAASVDLCYVACGRLDGFFEIGLKPWDMAAGQLLLEEAGGRLSDYSGGDFSIFKPELVATNGHIHRELIEKVLQAND